MSGNQTGKVRDWRIDFFRGLALIFIFVDHVPGNQFASFTLRNFGFSDAAEVFVFLAGYSAVLAYGRKLEADPLGAGTSSVFERVRSIYVWHLMALVLGAVLLYAVAELTGNRQYVNNIGFQGLETDTQRTIISASLLMMQPNLFNILPIYIVLLAAFPIVYFLLRWNILMGLSVLAVLWIAAGVLGLNFPTLRPDGKFGGWFLNPFGWVLLFACGAAAALAIRRNGFPYSNVAFAVSAMILVFGFLFAAPWTAIPGMEKARLIEPALLGNIDKTNLAFWRLAHVLALAYTTLALIMPQASWLDTKIAREIRRIGRHSLEVFVLGIFLSLTGWIVLSELGNTLALQMAVNALGIIALGAAAWVLSQRGDALKSQPTPASLTTAEQPRIAGRSSWPQWPVF